MRPSNTSLCIASPLGFLALNTSSDARPETPRDINLEAKFMPVSRDYIVKIGALFTFALAGCASGSYDAKPYGAQDAPGHVAVLMSDPDRAFVKLGAVSVRHFKFGWREPTVLDAEGELQAAGAQLGADAVIVRNSRNDHNYNVFVDGEAIRFK